MAFGNLTVCSIGFGARTVTAGIVTMGFSTLGSAPAPDAPPIQRTTVGGIGEYHIQLPRLPKKPEPLRFKRNMENRDRDDIQQIVAILAKAGII